MYRSPVKQAIETEHGMKALPRVFATFYLNRYPFEIVESDETIGTNANDIKYGIDKMMSVDNISNSYRFGHGNTFGILGETNARIVNYRVPGRVPQCRFYMAGDDTSYKYYISTNHSSNTPDPDGKGYLSSSGTYLGIPKIEYYDDVGNEVGFPGNSIVTKWNSSTSVPSYYKIYIKSRAIDTRDSFAWTQIYDSHTEGHLPIRTGERYGATHITNSDGKTTRIQLSKFDITLTPAAPDISGIRYGRRRTWQSTDYMDFDIGETISIMNVDNSINGVAKILNVNKQQGWIEVYGDFITDEAIDDLNYSVEIFSLNAGEMTIYRQDDGTWSTKENRWTEIKNNLVDIAGAKIEIFGVDKRFMRAELIELAPALSADFTKFTESVSITEELSDREVNIPIGTVSANQGSILLSNSSLLFDKTNTRRKVSSSSWGGSYFARMLDDGVEFKINYEMSSLEQELSDTIPSCPMISNTWEPGDGFGSVTVNLLDYANLLQNRPCPDMVLHRQPISTIIYMLLDKCAFSRVLCWPENHWAKESEPVVEYFWCQKEDNVWDALQELAKCTQTSIFFDKFGYLRILPLQVLVNRDRGVIDKNVWSLRGVGTNENLSNIISIKRIPSVGANHVSVIYHPVNVHGPAGVIARETFWLPQSDYWMGVAKLSATFTSNDTEISTFSDGNKPPFPRFSSNINFGNDIVKFDATQVELTQATGNDRAQPGEKRWIASEAERKTAIIDNNGQPVHFNGKLRVAPDQSDRATKYISSSSSMGFSTKSIYENQAWKNAPADSQLKGYNDLETWRLITRDEGIVVSSKTYDDRFATVIMKFKISDGNLIHQANTSFVGISLFSQSPWGADSMYLVGCYLGDQINAGTQQSGVKCIRVAKDGQFINVPKTAAIPEIVFLGSSVPIDKWCWLEAKVSDNKNGDITIELYLNGTKIGTFHDSDPTNGGPLQRNNNAGFFYQHGAVDIDKIIAMNIPRIAGNTIEANAIVRYNQEIVKINNSPYFSRNILQGNPTALPVGLEKDIKWTEIDAVYDQLIKQAKDKRGGSIAIHEFNSIITEYVEEYVRFENGPAISAEIINYNTNVSVDYFSCSPFGAKFRLRNRSNSRQQLSGSKELGDANEDVEDQYIGIVGNPIVKTDAQVVVTSKDYSQRIGDKRLEIDAKWLQHDYQAEAVAKMIIENQGDGAEIYSVSIYGNPLMCIGDEVDVDYAERGLFSGKHRYVIESISNTLEAGLKTEIVIRKIWPKATEIRKAQVDWT